MGTMDRNSTEVQEQTSDEKRTIANMASSTGDLEKNDNKTRAPSTVNAFQVSSQIGFSQWQPETVLSLNEFRGLMGIPLDETIDEDHGNPAKRGPIYALPAKINRPHTIPVWLRRIFIREDPESPTSIYYALIHEERRTRHKLRWYEAIIYGGLLMQLILAAAQIILGARRTTDGIAVATLGAAQGLIAGILSILKGQGLPVRFVRYSDALRRVRGDIDFHERCIRINLKIVCLADAIALRDAYEQTREIAVTNLPDVWQTQIGPDQNSATQASGSTSINRIYNNSNEPVALAKTEKTTMQISRPHSSIV